MKITIPFLVLFISFIASQSLAQIRPEPIPLTITSFHPTPKSFLKLLHTNEEILANTVLNEEVLDLVEVYVVDSIIKKKKEHHRVLGGNFISGIGINWRLIHQKREKYIGTPRNEIRIPSKPRLKEYDVNFNLIPHLEPYIELSCKGYERQKEIGRAKKKRNYDAEPFIAPTEKSNLKPYNLHCECTPSAPHLDLLNDAFYPTIQGNGIQKHPNMGTLESAIGLYGPFISDCNHACHPEIHPYEWIWWRNLNPDNINNKNPDEEIWMIGMLRDVSERMKHWVPAPRTGEIRIPFVFDKNKDYFIHLDHLVYNTLYSDTLVSRIPKAENAFLFDYTQTEFNLTNKGFEEVQMAFTTNHKLNSEGIRWQIESLNFDKTKQLISGYLSIMISVQDLYTAKLTYSHNRRRL